MPISTKAARFVAVLMVFSLVLSLALPVSSSAEGSGSKPAQGTPAGLDIKAASAILMDARSGQILFEKNAHDPRPPASVTKIMTLVVAFEALQAGKITLEDQVVGSEYASSMKGTTIFLSTGETWSMADMLKAIAVGSANDASVAVAEHIAGSHEKFVEMMNQKAQELGMHNTQFKNATGLPAEGHYMSAYDIAVLSRYAFKFPELIRLSSIYLDYIQGPRKDKFMLDNKNKLLKFYPGTNGLKTGMTNEAGYCISAAALRDGTQLIAVVLGSESRDMRSKETKQLLDYGFANYASVLVAKGGEAQSDVKVFRGRKDRVSVATAEDFAVSINKGDRAKLKKEIVLNKSVNAPIRKGDKLGDIVAIIDGQEVERAPLLALEDVPKTSIAGLTLKFFGGLFRFR